MNPSDQHHDGGLVERVARHLCLTHQEMDFAKARTYVQTVIEAMRAAPVVTTELFPDPIPSSFVEFAEVLWSRMIDEALK